MGNLVADQNSTLASDQMYLPRISANSIPVYHSIGSFGSSLMFYNKILNFMPLMVLATASMPFYAFGALATFYGLLFKVRVYFLFRGPIQKGLKYSS